MTGRIRALLVAIVTIAIVAGAVPVAVGSTSAAWTDRVYTTAAVKAGTWTTPSAAALSCAPVSSSVTATCTVTAATWSNWGSGYRIDLNITTTSTTAFEWVVTLNLAATGQPAPGGGTFFPGYPVPSPGSWQPAWTPTNFSFSNLCAASTSAALPTLKVKGSEAWDRTVSASAPVSSVGVQTTASGGSSLASLAC